MSETLKCGACGEPTPADDIRDGGGVEFCPRCAADNAEAIRTCSHEWEPYPGGEYDLGVICGKCTLIKEGVTEYIDACLNQRSLLQTTLAERAAMDGRKAAL